MLRTICFGVLCSFLGACSPTVKVNIAGHPGKLVERTVIDEPGRGGGKVAMIDVRGLIVDARRPGLLGEGENPVDRFVTALEMARKDAAVRAVVIRITSPGGTVTASDMMYEEVRRFSADTKKPVVTSIGEVGASGGYYLALSGDRIVVQPTAITGSIGVIFPTFNFSRGLNSIGIESKAITSGPNKDLANPFEAIRETQYDIIRGQVAELYTRFKSLVIDRRPHLKAEDIAAVTDGRIVTGHQAVVLGLADEEGGVREAYTAAKRLAGLGASQLVKYIDENRDEVNTPYAHAPTGGGDQVNLVQLNLGENGLGGRFGFQASGFYYLWMPDVP